MSTLLKRCIALCMVLCLAATVLPSQVAFAAETQPLNVMDFGAAGDGVTGDQAAIQAAIDAAAEGSGGGVVTLPAGTYLAEDFIVLKSNITLRLDDEATIVNGINFSSGPCVVFLTGPYTRGQGRQTWEGVENVTVTGGTIDMNGRLNAAGTAAKNLPLVSSSNAFALGYSSNIRIENMTFLNNYRGHAIQICACDGVTIINCTFEGQSLPSSMSDELKNSKELIQIEASSVNSFPYAANDTGEPAQNITIENCYFGASNACGEPSVAIGNHNLVATTQKCNNIVVRNNSFDNMSYAGVRFRGYEDVTIQGNTFTGGYKGIEVESCGGSMTMNGNVFSGLTYQNVRLMGCGDNGAIYFYTHGAGAVEVSTAGDTYTFTAVPSEGGAFAGYYKQNALTDLVTTNAVITFPISQSTKVYRHASFGVCSHSYTSTKTAPTCTEKGCITYTCKTCGHSYAEDIEATGHSYANGSCTVCGAEDPDYTVDYYLVGYINGADYGCEGDYANLGIYKFVDGKLTVTFDSASYVFIKTGDNQNWYMSKGYSEATSVTLYNTATSFTDPNKLFVPGNREITFTLTVNSNDTLTLRYEAGECTHKYNAVVTAPTCTADGYTTYTCACGDSYVGDIVLSTGHSYVNNVCSVCGSIAEDDETPVGNLFTLSGANMVLGGELDMNFFIDPTKLTGTDYYAQITLYTEDDTVTTTIPYEDWQVRTSYLVVTQRGLAARQMADKMDVVIYHGNGIQASVLWTDSVRSYAMRILEKQNAEAKTLLVDMLNYGAAAQEYFGYNTDDLANNLLSEAQQAYATQSASSTDQRVKGTGYYGSTLTLKNRIMLSVYFSNITPDMYAVVSFTDHKGYAHETRVEGSAFAQYNSSVYGVVVDELVVADGDQLVTVTVYDANGSVVATASDTVNSYVVRQMGSDPLYDMVMKFTTSAYAYFH